MKLSKALEGFTLALQADGYSMNTIAIYQWALSRMVTQLDDMEVEAVTTHVLLIEDSMKRRGINNRQAAMEIGIPHISLKRIREGSPYYLDTAKRISKWLGVNLSTLLDADGEGPDALANPVATLIETEPALARVFTKAMARIQKGEMSPDTVRELVRYAAYRLSTDENAGEDNEQEVQAENHGRSSQ